LEAGDSVIEDPHVVHVGANAGRGPVEIVAASLFATGAEPAVLSPSPSP
jgi:hypothetical protein